MGKLCNISWYSSFQNQYEKKKQHPAIISCDITETKYLGTTALADRESRKLLNLFFF